MHSYRLLGEEFGLVVEGKNAPHAIAKLFGTTPARFCVGQESLFLHASPSSYAEIS